MKENNVDVVATTAADAARMKAESTYGVVWPVGLYVIVGDSRSVLEARSEVDALIDDLQREADKLWPR